jgi:hypothetical protein
MLYSCAFIKREGRRLRMLRGLPGIKSVQLACTVLENISTPGMYSRGPSIFGIDPPNIIFRFGSNITPSVPHMVHLVYLNEIQDASA